MTLFSLLIEGKENSIPSQVLQLRNRNFDESHHFYQQHQGENQTQPQFRLTINPPQILTTFVQFLEQFITTYKS
jgi:hypothetical protein